MITLYDVLLQGNESVRLSSAYFTVLYDGFTDGHMIDSDDSLEDALYSVEIDYKEFIACLSDGQLRDFTRYLAEQYKSDIYA